MTRFNDLFPLPSPSKGGEVAEAQSDPDMESRLPPFCSREPRCDRREGALWLCYTWEPHLLWPPRDPCASFITLKCSFHPCLEAGITADPGTGALSRCHDLWSQCLNVELRPEMVEIKTPEWIHINSFFAVWLMNWLCLLLICGSLVFTVHKWGHVCLNEDTDSEFSFTVISACIIGTCRDSWLVSSLYPDFEEFTWRWRWAQWEELTTGVAVGR